MDVVTANDRIVRIGGAAGFWGDSSVAVAQLVERGNVDYLVFDYLAELTMSILVAAKAKDPGAGWARDFVDVALDGMLPAIARRGIRIVSNAGGTNPHACAAALRAATEAAGVALRIAVVDGDDVLARLPALREREPDAKVPPRALSANAYLGAFPIAAALRAGADIVITGRCVDSALVLGPLIAEFDWTPDDRDRLAGGSLAGHVLECGAQGTGGLHTDWETVERWDDIGYPIAECASDGSFVATKAPGTGGLVAPQTVGEQMLYEIGDPGAYVLPDVTCDFTHVTMTAAGDHRVRVAGARGKSRPARLKVAATSLAGYRCTGTLVIIGIDAARKARRTAEAILTRTRTIFSARGLGDYTRTHVETLGAENVYGPHARTAAAREVMMRLVVDHPDRRALEIFAREIAPAGTSWAPGTTGAGGGRPKVTPLVTFAGFSIDRGEVSVAFEIDGVRHAVADVAPHPSTTIGDNERDDGASVPFEAVDDRATQGVVDVSLVRLAWARSGDKGDTSNIGVLARRPAFVPYLRAGLTAERVAAYFAHLVRGPVRRYDVPGIDAFNFTLENALDGGGMASMRIDPLGKGFAQMLLDCPVPVPAAVAGMLEE